MTGDFKITTRPATTASPVPTPTPVAAAENSVTHHEFFGNTFANQLAAPVFANSTLAQPVPFPAGSIIVREKLIGSATAPDRLAVMVKRAPGFSPATGDWEFIGLSGDGATILERQTTGSCFACHTSQKSRDFVFTYEK